MSIETFELVSEKCTLAHINVRTEMHGEERRRAYDLKFTKDFSNSILKKFHPDLLDTFYCASKQQDVEADYKPNLKFGLMGPVSWDLEIPRVRLVIHDLDGNDLVLLDGKANKFKFEMLDGGTVKTAFRCQFGELDEDSAAKMLRALNETLPISLSCAAAEEQPDNFQQADLLSQEPVSEARKNAEAAFVGGDVLKFPDQQAEADPLKIVEGSIPAAEQVETEPVKLDAPAPRARRGAGRKAAAPE